MQPLRFRSEQLDVFHMQCTLYGNRPAACCLLDDGENPRREIAHFAVLGARLGDR